MIVICVLAAFAQVLLYCDGVDISTQTILEFGPLTLQEYSNIGSQEVIHVQIPSKYLSNFSFEWSSQVIETGSGISKGCPDLLTTVLVRKWSMPIHEPSLAGWPENTWMPNGDTLATNFTIHPDNPDEKYVMMLSDEGNATIDYYVAVFLSGKDEESIDVDGLSKDCSYRVELAVKAYSNITANVADINSIDYVQTIDSSSLATDYSLERSRKGILTTNYLTENKGYNISQNSSLSFSWMIESFYDVGGTLKIEFGTNRKKPNTTVTIKGCARWSSGAEITDGSCADGYLMVINSSNYADDYFFDKWYWPFPRSGFWTLELEIGCSEEDGCDHVVDLNVNVLPCIDSCQSDKSQGECKLYRTDVLFFSACDCKAGWQGIACTDGTNAIPISKQRLMTLMLTLSNLIFLPCGVLAVMKCFYTEAIVYFFVMFFSSFYHACDNEYSISMCIMKYDTLQFADFLGSVSAMWFTLIAVADLPPRVESWFHVAGLMAISIAVSYNRFSVFTTLIPVLCGLAIVALMWGRKCKSSSSCYPKKNIWFVSIIPGVLCAVIGFILFAFVENDDNYYYVHSMWHVLMGSAVLFLLPKKKKHWPRSEGFASVMNGSSTDVSVSHYNLNADSTPIAFHTGQPNGSV